MLKALKWFAKRVVIWGIILIVILICSEAIIQGTIHFRRWIAADGAEIIPFRYQQGSHRGYEDLAAKLEDDYENHYQVSYQSTLPHPVLTGAATMSLGDHGFRASCCWAGGNAAKTFFVFGGSTVFGVGADDDTTIVSDLNRLGAERRWRFVNYGMNGLTSSQELDVLTHALAAGRVPDAVIFYHGFNDANAAALNRVGIDELASDLTRMGRDPFYYVERRYFVGSGLWRIWKVLQRSFFPPEAQLIDDAQLWQAALAQMKGNRQVAVALGKAYGFEVYHFIQPSLAEVAPAQEATLSDFERHIRESQITPSLQSINEHLYQGLRDSGQWQDLSAVFFERKMNGVYFDGVHIGPMGNQAVAEAIYSALLQPATIPKVAPGQNLTSNSP
jgi:lysophospholipase L1-like esterase